MDCQTARLLLPYAARPADLGPEDTADLNAHLAECPTCGALAHSEHSFDSAVGRAMLAVRVPAELNGQIHARLAKVRGPAWHRPLLQIAAAAALLVVSASLIWWGNHKIDVNLETISGNFDDIFASAGNEANAEQIEAYFRDRGQKIKVPDEFDLTALAFYEMTSFEGHDVAHLDFQRGEARAHMFFLPKRHFRLPKGAQTKAEASRCTLEVIDGPGDNLILIVYCNGATRQHFQKTAIVG
jgi:hypothetical protein